jgi:DNA topoisomerase-1
LKADEAAFAALLAQADKDASTLARRAGAKGRKGAKPAQSAGIDGSLTSLLKKSRVVRKSADAKTDTASISAGTRR